MTRTVHFLIVYNKLSKTCCVSSKQANTVRQRRCQNAPKPRGGRWRRGPHAMAQLALWLIRQCPFTPDTAPRGSIQRRAALRCVALRCAVNVALRLVHST